MQSRLELGHNHGNQPNSRKPYNHNHDECNQLQAVGVHIQVSVCICSEVQLLAGSIAGGNRYTSTTKTSEMIHCTGWLISISIYVVKDPTYTQPTSGKLLLEIMTRACLLYLQSLGECMYSHASDVWRLHMETFMCECLHVCRYERASESMSVYMHVCMTKCGHSST